MDRRTVGIMHHIPIGICRPGTITKQILHVVALGPNVLGVNYSMKLEEPGHERSHIHHRNAHNSSNAESFKQIQHMHIHTQVSLNIFTFQMSCPNLVLSAVIWLQYTRYHFCPYIVSLNYLYLAYLPVFTPIEEAETCMSIYKGLTQITLTTQELCGNNYLVFLYYT